jgi:hypothetical protein
MGKATVALAFGDRNVPGDRRQKAGADLVALKAPPELHEKILDDHERCDAKCNHRYWIGHHRRGNRASAVGCALGWELGRAVEWCCRHLLPAFLALLCVSQAGANAGGMRALHRGGRWAYLGWLDWVRCGWPRGRVLQVGLGKVSWTYAPSVSTIPALKLMHEAGWGASQPREQAAGDPRSVTSSQVLGVAMGGFRADV